jgi:hypothetical protein
MLVKEPLPSGNFGKLLDEKRQRRNQRPCARRWLNVNIAALAQKLDEWAVMPDEVFDRHKARALELSRHSDPEVLRPDYEALRAQ